MFRPQNPQTWNLLSQVFLVLKNHCKQILYFPLNLKSNNKIPLEVYFKNHHQYPHNKPHLELSILKNQSFQIQFPNHQQEASLVINLPNQ